MTAKRLRPRCIKAPRPLDDATSARRRQQSHNGSRGPRLATCPPFPTAAADDHDAMWAAALDRLDRMASCPAPVPLPLPLPGTVALARAWMTRLIRAGQPAPNEVHADTSGCIHLWWRPTPTSRETFAHVEVSLAPTGCVVEAGEYRCLSAVLAEILRDGVDDGA